MRRNWRTITAAIAIGVIVLAPMARAEPLKIRVGWVVTPGHLAPLIEELGKRNPTCSSISARAM